MEGILVAGRAAAVRLLIAALVAFGSLSCKDGDVVMRIFPGERQQVVDFPFVDVHLVLVNLCQRGRHHEVLVQSPHFAEVVVDLMGVVV